jgi:hypothetical protein
MNAKDLADKFAKKVNAAMRESAKQEAASIKNSAPRLADVAHCKRAMTEDVVPFLVEVQGHFPENQFTIVQQIDHEDGKVVGVSFQVGDGPPTTITTFFGTVIVAHAGASGSSKGINFVYGPNDEPYISNSGDLTREKIAKLVGMVIDNV